MCVHYKFSTASLTPSLFCEKLKTKETKKKKKQIKDERKITKGPSVVDSDGCSNQGDLTFLFLKPSKKHSEYIQMRTHAHAYVCVRVRVMCVCVCVRARVCACVCVCVRSHLHFIALEVTKCVGFDEKISIFPVLELPAHFP